MPASRRFGEYLQRMHAAALEGLRECARLGAQACGQRRGYVPVFGDGTGIEGEGQLCEHAERGCHGEQQSWLPSVCVGAAGVSARLQAGGTDVKRDGREQLDQDAAPWLTGRQPVGLRADSADSCKELVSSCRRKGWDDSVSVTDLRQKAPLLRLVDAMGLREDEWEPLDAAGQERALAGRTGWPGGRRSRCTGCSGATGTGSSVCWSRYARLILVSRDRLPVAELVRRHRGQQGQENAFQGPLTDLGLQHPLCRSHAANQGFYLGGQIGQLLQLLLPYQALPSAARQHGLRPLIRYCVGSVGRLRRLCSRSNLRLDWLLPAASRRVPG